jgi:hypothetical protein
VVSLLHCSVVVGQVLYPLFHLSKRNITTWTDLRIETVEPASTSRALADGLDPVFRSRNASFRSIQVGLITDEKDSHGGQT